MTNILKVDQLSTRFFTESGQINAVEKVSFEIDNGEMFGIVGESGSGKSVTARSLMGLIDAPGRITQGEIWYRDESLSNRIAEHDPSVTDGEYVDLRRVPESVRKTLYGSTFAMIFQDPSMSFNPTITVGEQIAEAVEVQSRLDSVGSGSGASNFGLVNFILGTVAKSKKYVSKQSRERAIELLRMVDIPDPEERANEYPHEFSGGMLQRAMIAQALAGEPDLLIADEPTTGLDVTIEAQILSLLDDIQAETGMAIVLITHDLGVVSRMCDRVGVMYAGELVERGTVKDIFENPIHPYTQGLLGSIPDLEDPSPRLQPIDGSVPDLLDSSMGNGCYFADRCPEAMEKCKNKPPEYSLTDDHGIKCYLAEEESVADD